MKKTNIILVKLLLPIIAVSSVALFALAQNLNEPFWKAMPERPVTMGAPRITSVSNLWMQVENQATNTRLNYLVIRRSGNTFTLDAGEDKYVQQVEVP